MYIDTFPAVILADINSNILNDKFPFRLTNMKLITLKKNHCLD